MVPAKNPHIESGTKIITMNYKVLTLTGIVLAGFLLACGCTQTSAPGPVTPVTTVVPTMTVTMVQTVNTVTATTTEPEPVRTLPPGYAVAVDVASNGLSINPMIIATYRGGMGANYVYSIEMQVTRGDGTTGTKSITRPFKVGDTIEIASSGGNTDSAQVWVTLQNGERYKVYDQLIPFRQFH
ncbi:MAG TPA: hypothetical protein VMS89_04870 [Methanoregulaceae archaeon]|nr:hypothetical protein [Methanoregulaceae archaeon]